MLSSFTACGVDPTSPPTDTDAAALPDGLAIASRADDHVSGTFAKDGVAVAYELTTAADGSRGVVVRDAAGAVLFDSAIDAAGVETVTLLDRETIRGKPGDRVPATSGDPTAHVELAKRPEAKLIVPLRDAIRASDLPREMATAPRPTGARPDRFDGYTVYCGQVAYLPTYSVWWSSEFVRYDESRSYLAYIHVEDFWAIWNEVLLIGWYYNDFGPRWSFTLNVTNTCAFGPAPVYVGSDAF